MKTYNAWTESQLDLGKFLQVGDAIDQEMADYFLNVLPPACWRSDLIQIGEPYSHVEGRATYSTIRCIAGTWMYCGHCWHGRYTPALLELAESEVLRLKGLGWTQADFAQALKESLEGGKA